MWQMHTQTYIKTQKQKNTLKQERDDAS